MNILKEVTDIFKIIFDKADLKITLDTNAEDIEEWDSLKHINIIAMLEEHFHLQFEIDEIIEMENVGDMVKAIEKYIGGK